VALSFAVLAAVQNGRPPSEIDRPLAKIQVNTRFDPRGQKPSQIPPTQTPTPLGFSTLLCTADALVGGASLPGDPIVLFGGQVIIEATSAVGTSNGFSAIDVKITHGKSSSEHTITFIDTDLSGTLNCGDTIVSVS
jgi:hypothetical protein